jgi:WD40 repeat protein
MRFLRAHWTILQNDPFGVYHYIAFAPLSSIFQQIYASSALFPHTVTSIGVQPDWTSESVVQAHVIKIQALSACGTWFATGGSSNDRAIFAIWDMKTGDGSTTVHPCGSPSCSLYYISFDQQKDLLGIRTRCRCEKLCIWDIASEPIGLLREVQLKHNESLKWWADDYSKAISEENDALGRKSFLATFICGKETNRFDLETAAEDECTWIFSAGAGEKVARCSELMLEVFECSSGRQCFKTSLIPSIFGVQNYIWFSPDAEFIFYNRLGHRYTSRLGYTSGILSSKDGFQFWCQSTDRVSQVEFFLDLDRVMVIMEDSICFYDLLDGRLIIGSPHRPSLNLSVSPGKDQIAIMTQEGVEILDFVTLNPIRRYPWTESNDIEFANISWKYLTVVKITNRGYVDQSIIFSDLLSYSLQMDASIDTQPPVSRLFFSPDGAHLLTRHEDDSIQLWCASSGAKVHLTGDYDGRLDSNSRIEYKADSSAILIWGKGRNRLVIVDITTGRANVIPLLSSQIIAATLCPSSKHIFIIDQDGSAILISFDGEVLHSLGKILTTFTIVKSLVISPTERSIVVIGEGSISVIDYKSDLVPHRFDCLARLIQALAKFSPNGSHLLIAECNFRGLRFSLIGMSNCPLQRLIIAEPYTCHTALLKSLNTVILSRRQFFRITLKRCFDASVEDFFFDCSDGRMVACPTLRKERNGIYYGIYRLPITQLQAKRLYEVSEDNWEAPECSLAHVNDHGQVVVVNYSKYIDEM